MHRRTLLTAGLLLVPALAVGLAGATENARPTASIGGCATTLATKAVSCTFSGADDAGPLFFTVEWGDGSPPQRHPPTGFAASDGPHTLAHNYTTRGVFAVNVTATDGAATPLTSLPATRNVSTVDNPPVWASGKQGDPVCEKGGRWRASCILYGWDDAGRVFFTVDWGDGNVTRFPATGYLNAGWTADFLHDYAREGNFTVNATVWDDRTEGAQPSENLTWVLPVPPNRAPTLRIDRCYANPITRVATCELDAFDDEDRFVFRVDWGDGSPPERFPAEGSYSNGGHPSYSLTASHAYPGNAWYGVTANVTDAAPVPLTSADANASVETVDDPPVWSGGMGGDASCSAGGSDAQCLLWAVDDGVQVYFTVDWGDGNATRVPEGSGYYQSEDNVAASPSHRYRQGGNFTVVAHAWDGRPEGAQHTVTPITLLVDVPPPPPNAAPVASVSGCRPETYLGTVGACSFSAVDDEGPLFFTIDWGDGSPAQRHPPTGNATSWSFRLNHSFPALGVYDVTVVATDVGSPPRASAPANATASIQDNPPEWARNVGCAKTARATVACTAQATDDSGWLFYRVDWGDGNATRWPANGSVRSSWTQYPTPHAYAAPGNYTVTMTAWDAREAPQPSPPRLFPIEVPPPPPNAPPTANVTDCRPVTLSGTVGRCTITAADDEGPVYFTLDWGDGSPLQRHPATGYAAGMGPFVVNHTYPAQGVYDVTVVAIDGGAPSLASGPANATATILDQPPSWARAPTCRKVNDTAATCTVQATDDSGRVFYRIAWGDGTTTRLPATGYARSGWSQTTPVHAYGASGNHTVTMTAWDDRAAGAQSSGPRTASVLVPPPPGNNPPTATVGACATQLATRTVTCTVSAADDPASNVSFRVDWGDGSPLQRHPATGTLPLGAYALNHTYPGRASYTVTVVATEDASPLPLDSAPATVAVETIDDPPAWARVVGCYRANGTRAGCTLQATDDSGWLFYRVDWGDGNVTRWPATGAARSGWTQTVAPHAYATPGRYEVRATAWDLREEGAQSSPVRAFTVDVPPNERPQAILDSCVANPTTRLASCWVQATNDDGPVSFTLDWGDGSPPQRYPEQGLAAGLGPFKLNHTYAARGTYNATLTATDAAAVPLASLPATRAVDVLDDPPAWGALLRCGPAGALEASCRLHATDDAGRVYYLVDWGDGTTTRWPSAGYAKSGWSQTPPPHAYAVAGTYDLTLTAWDDRPEGAQPSPPATFRVTVA